MCNRAGIIIGWDYGIGRTLVVRANCDSWKCEDCAQRMAEHWGMRIAIGAREILGRGEVLDFVTITSHERLKTFAETERVWHSSWNSLYCALKRKNKYFSYALVPERHKDGRMHVHALWNAGVTQKWLKDNARKRGLGYQCKVINITSEGRAQQYVTKYIGKSLGDDCPPKFRRIRVSNNWADVPKPDNDLVGLRWEYIGSNGALQIVYEQCQERGISLIDAKTGEYFDDVDLGTIAWTG